MVIFLIIDIPCLLLTVFDKEQDAHAFLQTHHIAGLLIALFVSIPIINLATPLFANAFMTHLHKMLFPKTIASIPQK